MTTPVTVLVPRHHGAEAAEVVFDVFRQIDARMSEWKPTSPLTKVNNAAGRDAIIVPPDLRDVIRRGVEFGRASEGAFDITWAALWGLAVAASCLSRSLPPCSCCPALCSVLLPMGLRASHPPSPFFLLNLL